MDYCHFNPIYFVWLLQTAWSSLTLVSSKSYDYERTCTSCVIHLLSPHSPLPSLSFLATASILVPDSRPRSLSSLSRSFHPLGRRRRWRSHHHLSAEAAEAATATAAGAIFCPRARLPSDMASRLRGIKTISPQSWTALLVVRKAPHSLSSLDRLKLPISIRSEWRRYTFASSLILHRRPGRPAAGCPGRRAAACHVLVVFFERH